MQEQASNLTSAFLSQVNAECKILKPTEVLIDVSILNLDSTSMR